VTAGPQFLLTAFRVRSSQPDTSRPPIEVPLDELGIELGQPARSADIVAAEAELVTAFARRAYPLAEVLDRRVVVDHADNTVSVDIVLDTGPFARFGPADIRGLTAVEAEFVRNRLPWEVGAPFDLGRLEEARKRLVESNLFGSIRLTPADRLDANGQLPVVVELEERPHRTIGGALNWNSNEGFGIEAFWEHRNLMSAGEKIHLGAFYNELGLGAEAAYRNPDYWARDWDLIADFDLQDVETEAYDTSIASVSFGADLRLTDTWRVKAVGAVEYAIETDDGRERRFTLLSTPLEAIRDSTDDLLDPTRGGRFNLRFTPYYAVAGESDNFLRFDIGDSIYFLVLEEPRVILAGWADVGSILGGSRDGIPAQKRFYAGGGGSIRAYGFQMAGPLEPDEDPRGGLSLLAFGGEARVNVTEDIGIVPFLEAGTVYEERYPDFSEELRWGAGLGLRYYTGIGPIRADIAFPLNPRDADDLFQIYLSFGQAF
jgi:translocation and assembly module TamA